MARPEAGPKGYFIDPWIHLPSGFRAPGRTC